MVLLAVVFLIVPIIVLYFTKSIGARIGIMSVFSFLFALVITVATQSRDQEVFIALAA
jgi:hypothetical protein